MRADSPHLEDTREFSALSLLLALHKKGFPDIVQMSTKKAGVYKENLARRTLRELKIGAREGFLYAFNCSWSDQTIFPTQSLFLSHSRGQGRS